MNYTDNLKLKKPEQGEFYNVDDFNENAAILDETVKGCQDDIAKKSDSTHTHALDGDTITGVLPIKKGGTGTTTGHIAISQGTDTTSTASPAAGETFDVIDSVTKDSYGHITKVNKRTVKLPEAKSITVDSALDTSSTNPVQNKVVAEAINSANNTATAAQTAATAAQNAAEETKELINPVFEVGADDNFFTVVKEADTFSVENDYIPVTVLVTADHDITSEYDNSENNNYGIKITGDVTIRSKITGATNSSYSPFYTLTISDDVTKTKEIFYTEASKQNKLTLENLIFDISPSISLVTSHSTLYLKNCTFNYAGFSGNGFIEIATRFGEISGCVFCYNEEPTTSIKEVFANAGCIVKLTNNYFSCKAALINGNESSIVCGNSFYSSNYLTIDTTNNTTVAIKAFNNEFRN